MKFAGHTMGTPEYSLDEALTLFKKIGLDGAEIIVQDDYRCALPVQSGKDELQTLRESSRNLGLEISCLTPYFCNFNSLDEKKRDKDIQGIKTVIGYAESLNCHYIRIYGGDFAQGEQDETGQKMQMLVESLQYLGNIAEKAGVKLVVENHFNTMTVSARQSIEVINRINHPAVGILYDQANLSFTKNEDYPEALSLQKEKIYYTHVKDFSFKGQNHDFKSSRVSRPDEEDRNVRTRIVGEGVLNWPEILKGLSAQGYDGWLSFEYERRWHPQDIPDASEGMLRSFQYVKNCICN